MSTAKTYTWPPHGITCFHCGDHFDTHGAAEDHFGKTPDKVPGCIIKAGEERGLLMELRKAEATIVNLRRQCDQVEEVAACVVESVASIPRLFPGCRTINDVWMKFDALNGRVITLEAILKVIERTQSDIVEYARNLVCKKP